MVELVAPAARSHRTEEANRRRRRVNRWRRIGNNNRSAGNRGRSERWQLPRHDRISFRIPDLPNQHPSIVANGLLTSWFRGSEHPRFYGQKTPHSHFGSTKARSNSDWLAGRTGAGGLRLGHQKGRPRGTALYRKKIKTLGELREDRLPPTPQRNADAGKAEKHHRPGRGLRNRPDRQVIDLKRVLGRELKFRITDAARGKYPRKTERDQRITRRIGPSCRTPDEKCHCRRISYSSVHRTIENLQRVIAIDRTPDKLIASIKSNHVRSMIPGSLVFCPTSSKISPNRHRSPCLPRYRTVARRAGAVRPGAGDEIASDAPPGCEPGSNV